MKYKDEIAFWSDISLVALESIMSIKGDVNSIQYLNVRSAAEDVIRFMQKNEFTKDFLESHLSAFNEVREIFLKSSMVESCPAEFVPATLVAICVKKVVAEDIDDDTFSDLIMEAYSYLSNYQHKCI